MSDEKKQINSVVGDFFFGEVDEDSLFPYPHFSEEQKEIGREFAEAITKFAEASLDSEKMDRESLIPPSVIEGLAELGLMGLGVSEEFGGMGLDYTLYSRVFAEVASHDGSVATFIGAHQSIGYRALLNEGTEEQKKKYLPSLASGEKIAAFCLTEPSSGSDAYSIKTKAVENKDGSFSITGQKLWITNAGLADFYSVFAKTEHEREGKKVEKISCFIVEKGSEGLSFGEKENKMGIRASETRAVYFDGVKVPRENILGELGKGFKMAMNVLNSGRLSLGAGCVGGMKSILKMATKHAVERKQFGQLLAEFGMIQEKLATMSALTYAAESVVYMTTGNMGKGMKDYYLETAICKIFGSESLWEVVDTSLQIAAGSGYMKEYPYERMMRDSRINLIFEGTNEILRCFLSLSGMRGPSEKLKELGKVANISKALEDPVKSLGVLTDFAKKRLTKMMPSSSLSKVHPRFKLWAGEFSSLLSDFSLQVENTLIKYGKNIIGNEHPQRRLADMAIQLYVMVAVLSRTTAILNDEKIEEEQREYCFNLAQHSLRRAQHIFISNSKGMNKNMDKIEKEISSQVVKNSGYGLDIINF